MGHNSHVLDSLRPNDNLLCFTGHHNGPSYRKIIPNPGGLPHCLLRRHNPHNRRLLRPDHVSHVQKSVKESARAHALTKDRRWPSLVHIRHGCGRAAGNQEIARGAISGPAEKYGSVECLLAGSTVRVGGVRGGVYVHGAARFLLKGVPERDEDDEHGVVFKYTLFRVLCELNFGQHCP